MLKQDLSIAGPVGAIEAVLQLPDAAYYTHVAVACHPDPLQDGNMQNKVVTTIAKAFNAMQIPCVRFNYRGVGNSNGEFGHIDGEVADCLAVVAWVQQQWPQAQLYLSGFSFGAYVAAKVATKVPCKQLISIAPSVVRMPYYELPKITCPWLVIEGEADEVVDPVAVYAWFDQLDADKTLIKFAATGHFFHGKLAELQSTIQAWLT